MSETRCPVCGEHKQRIAQHWALSGCGYPSVPADQRAVLDGIVLAGATVAGNGSNRHLTIGTTSESLAEWTADALGWLCHGVRTESFAGDREDVYRVRTPAHPSINRYERWAHVGDNSGRVPPETFRLGPAAARIWWAFAGGIEWGEYDSQRQGIISAADTEKQRWIVRVLEDAGFDPTPVDRRVKLPPSDLDDWLSWAGDPVPGVGHKWAQTIAEYDEKTR